LRLQYVCPDIAIDRDGIQVVSDFGAELRDYVLGHLARARRA
jgi:hypothetical protein